MKTQRMLRKTILPAIMLILLIACQGSEKQPESTQKQRDTASLDNSWQEMVSTAHISDTLARRFHHYYLKTKLDTLDHSRAIFYNMKLLQTALNTLQQKKGGWDKVGFYAYWGKYDEDIDIAHPKNQTTTIIQLAYIETTDGKDTIRIEPGAIYDLGDLCPPRCPLPVSAEQITDLPRSNME